MPTWISVGTPKRWVDNGIASASAWVRREVVRDLRPVCDKIPRQLSAFVAAIPPMTWWVFDNDSGVLELDDSGLELHWRVVEGRTLAWWVDADGHMLSLVDVGVA